MLKQMMVGLVVVAMASAAWAGPRVDRELRENEVTNLQKQKERLDAEPERVQKMLDTAKAAFEKVVERYGAVATYGADYRRLGEANFAEIQKVLAEIDKVKAAMAGVTDYRSYVKAQMAWLEYDLVQRRQRLAQTRFSAVSRLAALEDRMARDKRTETVPAAKAVFQEMLDAAKKVRDLEVGIAEASIAQGEMQMKINEYSWLTSQEMEERLAEAK